MLPDTKIVLPPKERVLTKMEELIHHFINVTQGMNAPPGEVYFAHGKSEGRARVLHQQQGRRHAVSPEDPAPSFVNLSILPHVLPGHMVSDVVAILGSFDFVMGECDR